MALDGGLVWKIRGSAEWDFASVLFDRIAKSNRKIPLPFRDCPSQITISVDDATRSFRIFLVDDWGFSETYGNRPLLSVHESTKKELASCKKFTI